MPRILELVLHYGAEHPQLRSPEVGLFTCPVPAGSLLAPGAAAGVLHSLGRRFDLVVPAGASGCVVGPPPRQVLAPVGYGTTLYELAALAGALPAKDTSAPAPRAVSGALVFRAPYSGRFWQRPAPTDPPFLNPGDELGAGKTVGLIEVMKTFTHLVYRPDGELPARARVVRFLVADGGEVEDGGALLELEPA